MDLPPLSAHPFPVNFSNVTKHETLLKVVQSFLEIKKTLAFGFVQASTLEEVIQGSNDRQKDIMGKFFTKTGWGRGYMIVRRTKGQHYWGVKARYVEFYFVCTRIHD